MAAHTGPLPRWPRAVTAVVLLVAALVPTAPARSATAPLCPGQMPDGYALAGRMPYVLAAPYEPKAVYQPQSIAAFTQKAAVDDRNTPAERDCWVGLGIRALLAGSRTVVLRSGERARVFPYGYDFVANPRTPVLRAGWVSALGHVSAAMALEMYHRRTGDPLYLTYTRQAFAALSVDAGPYAMVTRRNGLTFLEEYPTDPPSYVLNGNNESLLGLDVFARRYGDARAAALREEVLASLRTTLPLYEVVTTPSVVTSYDLLRGYPAAPLRAVGSLSLSPVSVQAGRRPTGSFHLPVVAATSPPANLLQGRGSGAGLGRIAPTDGPATVTWTVPASRVRPGQRYRLSVHAALERSGPAASGVLHGSLWAVCDGRRSLLARSQVRHTGSPAWVDVVGTTPARRGCGLRVDVTAPAAPLTVGHVDAVTLSRADLAVPAVHPTPLYPISVLDHPELALELTYTGSGHLQAHQDGRWVTIAPLPTAERPRSVRIPLPAWTQGRNVNLKYHEHHVAELDRLGRATTCESVCRQWGRRWLDAAPGQWGRLSGLAEPR